MSSYTSDFKLEERDGELCIIAYTGGGYNATVVRVRDVLEKIGLLPTKGDNNGAD